jgi:hypothetical protein
MVALFLTLALVQGVYYDETTSAPIEGVATYYCWPAGHSRCTHGYPADGAYAAAGPELRAALGPHYKGKHVFVNGVEVTLIDWCACGGNHVIDVYHSTWVKIPHPNHVTVTLGATSREKPQGLSLPATDTQQTLSRRSGMMFLS